MDTLLVFFNTVWAAWWSGAATVVGWFSSFLMEFLGFIFDPERMLTAAAWYFRVLDWLLDLYLPDTVMAVIHQVAAFFTSPGQVGYHGIVVGVWMLNLVCDAPVAIAALAGLWGIFGVSLLLRLSAWAASGVWTKWN